MQDPRWNGSPPGVRPGELKDRWRALNGAISAEQLAWLEGELQAAQAQAQRALIVSHCPMHPEAVPGVTATLLWNYEDVLAVLWRHPRVVAATVAGAYCIAIFASSTRLPYTCARTRQHSCIRCRGPIAFVIALCSQCGAGQRTLATPAVVQVTCTGRITTRTPAVFIT